MSNRRRPTGAPRNKNAWGPPSRSLAQGAAATGRNTAIAEFYKAVTEKNWQVQNDFRDARLSRMNDNRDYRHARALNEQRAQITEDTDDRRQQDALELIDHREDVKSIKDTGSVLKGWDTGSLLGGMFEGGSTGSKAANFASSFNVASGVNPKSGSSSSSGASKSESDDHDGGGFWDTINRAADKFNSAVGHGIVEGAHGALNMATGGNADFIEREAHDVAETVGRSHVAQATKHSALWSLDKLMRPLYGTNTAVKYLFDQDEEAGSIVDHGTNPIAKFALGGAFGQNILESVDDLEWKDFEGFGNAFNEGMRGHKKTLTQEIIAGNARRNPAHDFYDNKHYQIAAGLVGDVISDPLTYVGVGFLKNVPTKAADLIKMTESESKATARIWKDANEAAQIGVKRANPVLGPQRMGPVTLQEHLAGLGSPNLDAQEIFSMLGGYAPRAASRAEKIGIANTVKHNANYIAKNLQGPAPVGLTRRAKAIQRLGKMYQAEKNAAVDNFEGDAVLDAYRKELELDVQSGKKPESVLDSIPEAATHAEVRRALVNHRMKDKPDFTESLGERWKNDPRFTDAERESIVHDALALGRSENTMGINTTTKEINDLLHQKRTYEGVIRSAKAKKGNDWEKVVRQAEGSIHGIETKLKPLNMRKDNIHASLIINLARTKIANGGDFALGATTYRDLAEAGQAQTRLRTAYRQLTDMGEELQIPTELDWNPARILEDVLSEEERAYKPGAGNTSTSNTGVEDAAGYTTADDLQQQVLDAAFELHNMKTKFNSFTDRDLVIPFALKNEDGTLRADFDTLIRKQLDYSTELDKFAYKPTGNKEVDHFLGQIIPEINADYVLAEKTIRANYRRGVNEVDQHARTLSEIKTKANSGDNVAKKLLTMFAPHGDRGVLTPYVTVDGAKVFRGTNASDQVLRDAKLITKKDVERSTHLKERIKHPEAITKDDARVIRARLEDAGVYIPNGLKQVKTYISRNFAQVDNLLEPKDFVWAREFKKQHGVSYFDARIKMDEMRGRVVTLDSGPWAKRHPNGLTENEWLRDALKDKDAFSHHAVGGPVPLKVKDAPNDMLKKTLAQHKSGMRERGASAEQIKALEQRWTTAMWNHLEHIGPTEAQKMLKGSWQYVYKRKAAAEQGAVGKAAKQQADKTNLTPKENAEIALQARKQTVKTVLADIKNGNAVGEYKDTLPFMKPMSELGMHSGEDELYEAIKHKFGVEHANLVASRAGAARKGDKDVVSELDGKIEALRAEWKQEKARIGKIKDEAKQARQVFKNRLTEDAIFKVLNAKMVNQNKAINLNIWGAELMKVPGSEQMFKAVEKFGDMPVIAQARQAYANAFISPAARQPKEAALMMSRYKANTAEIIGHHVRRLDETLAKFPDKERATEFKKWKQGVVTEHPIHAMLDEEFGRLLPYFKGEMKVGDGRLLASDIIHHLPDEIKVHPSIYKELDKIKTPHHLANYIAESKVVDGVELVNTSGDPLRAAWTINIAAEQAMAQKALYSSINSTFGIKRSGKINHETGQVLRKTSTVDEATHHTIEQLGTKANWKTIKELGQTHYFPPEAVESIQRLLDMTKPRNVSEIGKLIDEATGIWKVGATLYNPGYYTRNGVGEVMSGWFGGVNHPKYYKRAMTMTKYNRNEGKELEALKSHFPALEHVQSTMVKGNEHIATLKNGQKITVERAHILYHDQGLRTGFLNTEFENRASGQVLKEKPGVKQAVGMHRGIQQKGEGYEDYFRMAHFLHALEHAPAKSEKAAAEYAAEQVRKYHFDYTDFTNIEKTVMLRAFPFYKWSRKALPLMSTMLFMKPGKMTAYMKAANAVSQTTISTGDMSDPNGFMPNYQGIVPGWMQDMWAYQLSGDPDNAMGSGTQTFGNLATPQMDTMKQADDPVNAAWALTNPLFKLPIEAGAQQTFGNMPMPIEGAQEQGDHLARALPAGSFLDKMYRGKAGGSEVFSFLTGLGAYQNNDNRRQGELGRRADNAAR